LVDYRGTGVVSDQQVRSILAPFIVKVSGKDLTWLLAKFRSEAGDGGKEQGFRDFE
ncbi:hypothetical protein T484DRAFT_1787564, partial [Baffinella frigidus]